MLLTLLALATPRAALADVLINEVLYDPDGTDTGAEWIELCNSGTDTIDLTGWTVEAGGGTFATIGTITSGTIAPGQYLLLGATSSTHPDALSGTMQNSGDGTDGVRLVDAEDLVVDTVLYGEPNSSGLVDDSGTAGTAFGVDVAGGNSLARVEDCVDTDDPSIDFYEVDEPTPEASNHVEPRVCSNPGVVINELLPNRPGSETDSDTEYVELYNAGGATADLSEWAFQWGTQSYDNTAAIEEGVSLAPGDYLVFGGEEVALADYVVSFDMGGASSNADALRLVDCNGEPVDTVVYGSPNSPSEEVAEDEVDQWVDDTGEVATSTAPTPGDGVSLGRRPNGVDTDDCGVDFVSLEVSTPGADNDDIPDCPGSGSVKVNEFLANPTGDDEFAEWIEIVNVGSDPVDLLDWTLQWGKGSYGTGHTWEESTTLAPGDYLLIGGSLVEGADVVPETALDLGNAGTNADAIRLRHCMGGIADVVAYGPTNTDLFMNEAGEVIDDADLAPAPSEGQSIGRCPGEDDSDSGTDFATLETATPGEENGECPVCQEAVSNIVVNELFPNPDSTDEGSEWIELYNAGDTAQRLDAWTVEGGTSAWGLQHTFGVNVEIAPGAYLLLGESNVPADVQSNALSLGNASTSPDGIRLVDCLGAVRDTVLWGGAGDEPEAGDLVDDDGGLTMGVMPSSGLSLGRYPNGVDTNDNAADFATNMPPTPGGPNEVGSGTDGTGGEPPGAGCSCAGSPEDESDTPDDTDAPGGESCSTVPAPGAGLWLALLVAGLRRRRERS